MQPLPMEVRNTSGKQRDLSGQTQQRRNVVCHKLWYGLHNCVHTFTTSLGSGGEETTFSLKPGSYSLSVASLGCNFKCQFCNHYDVDHRPSGIRTLDPTQIVQKALALRSSVISYTYNEPTVFLQYALDVAEEAKKSGLENAFITNGYVNSEGLDLISGSMQAAVVGVKGSLNKGFYENVF